MTELERQLAPGMPSRTRTSRTAAHAHWASLAKPPQARLGRLETMLEDAPPPGRHGRAGVSRRATRLVLCADNGVVAQGVKADRTERDPDVAENLAARQEQCTARWQSSRCEVVPVVRHGRAVLECRTRVRGTADFTDLP